MAQATTGLPSGSDGHPSRPRGACHDVPCGHPRWHGVDTRKITTAVAAVGGWCAYVLFVVGRASPGHRSSGRHLRGCVGVAQPDVSRDSGAGPSALAHPSGHEVRGVGTGVHRVAEHRGRGVVGRAAFTVGSLVPVGWRRVLATWAILAFATSTPIILWNRLFDCYPVRTQLANLEDTWEIHFHSVKVSIGGIISYIFYNPTKRQYSMDFANSRFLS